MSVFCRGLLVLRHRPERSSVARECGMEASGSRSGLQTPADGASGARGFDLSDQEKEASKAGGRASRGNWLGTHPTFTKMMSLDVADSSSVYAAFLVYLDLLEVRNWYEVSFFGLAEFQLVGLRGREREAEDFQVVMPTPVHVSFSHERLRQIMKRACALENNPDSSLSLTLAIVESDSTIVYYKLTDGFVMPNPPEDTKEMDDKQWKKKKRKKAWRH
ncbi:tRNA-splicing endonuclease subunit Sen15 isoform X2 [Pogona vitticeps]